MFSGIKTTRSGCPHRHVQFCPLYVASHGWGGGCDDGRANEGGCAVDRGLNYGEAVKRLRDKRLKELGELSWAEHQFEAAMQRDRNMKRAGVH